MFADDDIEADPGWVEAVTQTLENPNIALVGGNNYPLFEEPPPEWLRRWWERPVYKGRALGSLSILDFGEGVFDVHPGYVWGCNYSIRRESLLKAGGFHPDSVPKERLLFRGDGETHVSNVVRKSGFRTVFNSRASVWHFVPSHRMTREYLEQRAYAQGISDSYSAIRQSGGVKFMLGQRLVRRLASFRPSVELFMRIFTSTTHPALHELLTIQRSVKVAYWEGYEFHRRMARRDPALLSWILKKDYLS
jgi:GT2 family glycosyltransferase